MLCVGSSEQQLDAIALNVNLDDNCIRAEDVVWVVEHLSHCDVLANFKQLDFHFVDAFIISLAVAFVKWCTI